MTTELSQAAQNLNWLITNFADQVPGVAHTVVVSADGLGSYPGLGLDYKRRLLALEGVTL